MIVNKELKVSTDKRNNGKIELKLRYNRMMYAQKFTETQLIKHGICTLLQSPIKKSVMVKQSLQNPYLLIYQNPIFDLDRILKNKVTGSIQLSTTYHDAIAYEVTTSMVIIGRGNETYGGANKISLADSKVSRLHSTIFYSNKEHKYKIVDGILELSNRKTKRSANGIYFEEKRIYSHQLENGDKLRIGNYIIEWYELPEKIYNSRDFNKNTLF